MMLGDLSDRADSTVALLRVDGSALRGYAADLIAEMKEVIRVLREGYDATGYEAAACPGCVYEEGVFIRRCELHKRIDNLEKKCG